MKKKALKDPIQAAWIAGAKYFWNRPMQVELLREAPACTPEGPPGFTEAWRLVAPYTLLDIWRAENIASLLYRVRALPGDVMECGVYQGGMGMLMALLLQQWGVDKKVYMLDSFQGLPKPDPSVDRFHKAGWLVANVKMVEQVVSALGLKDRVVVVPGWFEETLPALPPDPVCLAHLDGDLYASTVTCLAHVGPRVVAGGVVVVDDYNDAGEGVHKAVNEYARAHGCRLQLGPIPQVYFRAAAEPGKPIRGRIRASTTELKRNRPYHRMLAHVSKRMKQEAKDVDRMLRRVFR